MPHRFPMSRILRAAAFGLAAIAALATAGLVYAARTKRAQIDGFEAQVIAAARAGTAPVAGDWSDLPAPVQRYFAFAFPGGVPPFRHVSYEMRGQFRRPLTPAFNPTRARQVVNLTAPDMVFSADTPVLVWPLWAIAYDIYLDGEMEMHASLLSALTVMEEGSTPALNRTSLRRWLLESPAYPMALLPGGPVTWEPIDDRRARAVVRAHGREASLVARFAQDGSLERFDAEEDGDLTTPYHGSGEHTARSDYRLVQGVMVPMAFTIARAAEGEIHPFWTGRITDIRFDE